MTRYLTAALAPLLIAAPVWAQPDHRVEIQVNGGFTLSEGIPVDENRVGGDLIDRVTPKSGGSYGVLFGIFLTEQAQVGFNFNQQFSTLELKVNAGVGKQDVTDMKVNNYHGTFAYHWGFSDSLIRPFFMGGLGATNYTFDPIMGNAIDSSTRFSTTWGGGVKIYPTENIGVNFTARWTPTYINSDPGGIWCSPYWPGGCWVVSNANYSNQFELGGGINFRF